MTTLNEDYSMNGISANSYSSIVNGIKEFLKDESNSEEKLYSFFKPNENQIEKFLKELYFDEIGFEYMKSDKVDTLSDKREIWLSGKCLAVSYKTWNNLLKEI